MSYEEKIILGVDPGSKITGYGFIKKQGDKIQIIDFGCIKPPVSETHLVKNKIIFEGITHLLKKFKPQALSVETQFVHPKNFQAGIKIGMTRGVIALAATLLSIPVFEYTPLKAKQSVVGTGKATKAQVQAMIMHLLNLATLPEPEDAADALALAICHAHELNLCMNTLTVN